jgi:hypothetical protein
MSLDAPRLFEADIMPEYVTLTGSALPTMWLWYRLAANDRHYVDFFFICSQLQTLL